MPTYVYECLKCDATFEYEQKITDKEITQHNQAKGLEDICSGEVKRVLSPPHIVLKGDNWEGHGKKGY